MPDIRPEQVPVGVGADAAAQGRLRGGRDNIILGDVVPAWPHPVRPVRNWVLNQELAGQRANNAAEPEWVDIEQMPEMKKPKQDETATITSVYMLRIPSSVLKIITQHKGKPIMGVELEIENFPVGLREAEATGMGFTDDGSLRNNGVEAITKPNTVEGLMTVIPDMWKKYNITEANYSDRTSIHVHCNVTHFTQNQIQTLVLLYSLFEEILFDVVGQGRKDNIFCVPWCEAGIHAGNYHRVWTHAARWQKYTALNLRPVSVQGTVEFRHMYGHCNRDLLQNWLMILQDIMLAAEHMNHQEIYNRVIELNTSSEYHKFLRDVFPTTADFLMLNSPEWNQHLIRGVIEAKLQIVA